jgi:hypothetical protein
MWVLVALEEVIISLAEIGVIGNMVTAVTMAAQQG